jgi:carbonic anhydrase
VIVMGDEDLLRRYLSGGQQAAADGARGLDAAPTLHTVVLTCMDTRIDAYALFGVEVGEVHMLRNAGGVVTDDVVRSVVISQRKLGTREVLVVQHTACGLTTFTDEEFAAELAADVGAAPPWRPQAFADPVSSARAGVARLRSDPFLLPETVVRGFVLDIEDFTLDEVPAGG